MQPQAGHLRNREVHQHPTPRSEWCAGNMEGGSQCSCRNQWGWGAGAGATRALTSLHASWPLTINDSTLAPGDVSNHACAPTCVHPHASRRSVCTCMTGDQQLYSPATQMTRRAAPWKPPPCHPPQHTRVSMDGPNMGLTFNDSICKGQREEGRGHGEHRGSCVVSHHQHQTQQTYGQHPPFPPTPHTHPPSTHSSQWTPGGQWCRTVK